MSRSPRLLSFSLIAAALALSACATTGSAPDPSPAPPAPIVQEEALPEIAPLVQQREEASHRVAPHGAITIRWLASGTNAYLGELYIEPGTVVPPHQHSSEEYLLILEGGGVLTIEGVDYQLGPGSVALIPARHEHSFVNGPEPTLATQVFASPEGALRYLDWEEAP